MTSKLKDYFPSIRTREQILNEIRSKDSLTRIFNQWDETQQTEFLDFCTGTRGFKILYDFMFKEILNPETTPGRLESLLSCLLEQPVHIVEVLPNDSARIADESSLLITDIIVRLADGRLCNIEMQKIGYAFPGERCACYSSDLLLRQYKRVRDEKRDAFTYRDIQQVYTIIFFEKSTSEFHAFMKNYLHRFEQTSNTGLKLNLLQKFVFVSLDIYRKIHHNKSINSKLEAWLTFLSADDPETIIRLITAYPEFKPLYRHIYDMCRNMECVMGLFSKELLELDRNTVRYMMDEMQMELDQTRTELDRQKQQLAKKDAQIADLKKLLAEAAASK